MDKAPERIWVQNDTKDHREELSEMAVEPVPEVTSCFQEYTRTDISNALIAAAYEAALSARGMWFGFNSVGEPDGSYCTVGAHDPGGMSLWIKADRIRDLTPDDARAAYDAAIRAAKIEGIREAANRANGCDRVSEVAPAITALIEETEKGGV